MKTRQWPWIAIAAGCALLLLACTCTLILGASVVTLGRWLTDAPLDIPVTVAVATPVRVPTIPAAQLPELWQAAQETRQQLENTLVPENDPLDLAVRLGQAPEPVPSVVPSGPYQVGDRQEFWVTNTDTNKTSRVSATLRYVTDHLYFWIADDVDYDKQALARLAQSFEEHIYPTVRSFFGSEWTPGIDGDPHLYVLYTHGMGNSVAGYFSSADEVPPLAHEYSNAHEMFFLSADNVALDEDFTYGVLAHEFQHMIHWYRDRNETSWLNEGFSELAAFLAGFDIGRFDYVYLRAPDLQLNTWPSSQQADTSPHYGAGFLFVTYFLDRFGEQATRALVAEPQNGLVSVDRVLADLNATDPLTGKLYRADDFFQDWTIANLLRDEHVADGRYTYLTYPDVSKPNDTEHIHRCPSDTPLTTTVHQYGVDYIRITCRGDYTLHFEGTPFVSVLPVDPHSGEFVFWSNRGDESDMTLTRQFDFTGLDSVTLTYWMWYDIEQDYDYVYLEASTDGEHWTILTTPSGTGEDPSGNSYGWAYNGQTGQWVQERVDLSPFAGQQVYLRFEYVTDAAVNGEGFLLDDIAIPELGYLTDFEQDDGGWQAAGFVRLRNRLPQTYRVALVTFGKDTTVQKWALSGDQPLDVPLHLEEDAVFVVSGTTRFTLQPAVYTLDIR